MIIKSADFSPTRGVVDHVQLLISIQPQEEVPNRVQEEVTNRVFPAVLVKDGNGFLDVTYKILTDEQTYTPFAFPAPPSDIY